MDRFLEKINLPSLNQQEIEIMSNSITSTETDAVVKNLPKNKSPGPDGFTEFYQTFRDELMCILLKLFQKNCRGRNTSKLILWGHHHPDTKTRQRQHTHKRKLQANITDEHRCKNPQQNFSKQNSATHQKAHIPWSGWVYSSDARILQYMQINVIHYINKLKGKNHMIISIDEEKVFDKIQHPCMNKLFKKWA